MDQEHDHFLIDGMPSGPCLSGGRVQGDYHITEERRSRPWDGAHRKGEDIGWAVDAAIPPIQASHVLIADERDAQLGVCCAGSSQHSKDKASAAAVVQGVSPKTVPNHNRHQCG
jgi:hypothetical protein